MKNQAHRRVNRREGKWEIADQGHSSKEVKEEETPHASCMRH